MTSDLEYPDSTPPLPQNEWKDKYDDLVRLLRNMRRAQKHYFASRTKEDLIEAKSLEKLVDDILFT